jgi:predicted KAP-like P-loop ATPase
MTFIISKYIGDQDGRITQVVINSFKVEFNSKVEVLNEIDRDTLYFDGFEEIRKEINNLRNENPYFRIIDFIDDLDRCSPKKTIEILETIKVFSEWIVLSI